MRRALACAAVLIVTGGACAGSASRPEEILVFAAASLTEAFTAIGKVYERADAGVRVRFNFGPSDGLATGINQGAPADVFASASPRWMDAVERGRGIVERRVFARNRLVVIVPRDNPAGLRSFADLARPGVKLVIAAPGVPAGAYAREALANAALEAAERNVVSHEEDVKGVVQKVVLGEADAGIVYATDVTGLVAPTLSVIAIPEEVNVIASYPIAVVADGTHRASALSFIAFVGTGGRRMLSDAGFLEP